MKNLILKFMIMASCFLTSCNAFHEETAFDRVIEYLFRYFLDSNGYRYINGKKETDEDSIKDEFLIENIDLAFDSWKQPWAKDIPFEDFCKYILPYRNVDESLSGWRRKFKEKYEPTIADSVKNLSSLREVSQYLMRREA